VADFEPEVALYGGDDGLDLYRKMFEQLLGFSWRPRLMIGEFGFGQQEEMQKLLEQNFASAEKSLGKKITFEIIPDLAGIPRVFVVNFI
jgi:release factor glutamine methyltransferase